jgi:hypothetical protein
MSRIPQNGEEAGLAAFALVDALIERLVTIGTLDRGIVEGIYIDAELVLKNSPQLGADRASEFLSRRVSLGQPSSK